MTRAIFVDRDGTIIAEPEDEQVDSLEKLSFVPGAISALKALTGLGFELVMVTNQDGLGTAAFPEEDFYPAQNFMLRTLEGEGVVFDDILIDRHFPEDNSPCRKPGTGMFTKYLDGSYNLSGSYVIGDRDSDMELARNLGAKGLKIGQLSWDEIVRTIRATERSATVERKTAETDIRIRVDLDGKGESSVDSGLKFFDHMLNQLIHHGGLSLELSCKGDLEVDEHHTMEDVGIALGEAIRLALGDKRGINRYGFVLPMDESRAIVLLDFGGRSELVWDVVFTREMVGDVPTEMFKHFFKSLCDSLRCNLYIQARGENNHHLIEGVFKAFSRTIRQAAARNVFSYDLPSSKGLL